MGVTAGVAAVVGATAAAAGTGYTIYKANEASDKADAAAKEQAEAQARILAEQKKQTDQAKTEADQMAADAQNLTNRNSAAARVKALATNAQGRSSTILTSPLGVPNANAPANGSPLAPGKTLLGL